MYLSQQVMLYPVHADGAEYYVWIPEGARILTAAAHDTAVHIHVLGNMYDNIKRHRVMYLSLNEDVQQDMTHMKYLGIIADPVSGRDMYIFICES